MKYPRLTGFAALACFLYADFPRPWPEFAILAYGALWIVMSNKQNGRTSWPRLTWLIMMLTFVNAFPPEELPWWFTLPFSLAYVVYFFVETNRQHDREMEEWEETYEELVRLKIIPDTSGGRVPGYPRTNSSHLLLYPLLMHHDSDGGGGDGNNAGYGGGHNIGYDSGYVDGYASGYEGGYDSGCADGFDGGFDGGGDCG